jgi:hypothetical protein
VANNTEQSKQCPNGRQSQAVPQHQLPLPSKEGVKCMACSYWFEFSDSCVVQLCCQHYAVSVWGVLSGLSLRLPRDFVPLLAWCSNAERVAWCLAAQPSGRVTAVDSSVCAGYRRNTCYMLDACAQHHITKRHATVATPNAQLDIKRVGCCGHTCGHTSTDSHGVDSPCNRALTPPALNTYNTAAHAACPTS